MRIATVVLLVLAAAICTAPAPAVPAALFERFSTPSRNIACLYAPPSGGGRAYLRCDVLSGLRPEPRARCELDWTGAAMNVTGRARLNCAGDTVADPRSPLLAYGRTWRRGGFSCASRRDGLRCTNRGGHGFLLARERWRVF